MHASSPRPCKIKKLYYRRDFETKHLEHAGEERKAIVGRKHRRGKKNKNYQSKHTLRYLNCRIKWYSSLNCDLNNYAVYLLIIMERAVRFYCSSWCGFVWKFILPLLLVARATSLHTCGYSYTYTYVHVCMQPRLASEWHALLVSLYNVDCYI